jgi:hypothetical protein
LLGAVRHRTYKVLSAPLEEPSALACPFRSNLDPSAMASLRLHHIASADDSGTERDEVVAD